VKTVGLNEILSRMGAGLSPGEAVRARRILNLALDAIGAELKSGNRIALPGLPALLPKTDGGEEAAEERKPAAVLLFVPKLDAQVDLIAHRLEASNHAATALDDREVLERVMDRHPPDVLVIDSAAPHAADLVAKVKCEREKNGTAVVMLYRNSDDRVRVNGLRVWEDENLTYPYRLEDLVGLITTELDRKRGEARYFSQDVHLQFQTEEKSIEAANDLMASVLAQSDLREDGKAAMSVAFHEAVDNAARHGNGSQPGRLIDVVYLLDREKVTVTVEDEGPGFDTAAYVGSASGGAPAAMARERIAKGQPGGLGILLMIRCTDGLEYSKAGSRVRLTKRTLSEVG